MAPSAAGQTTDPMIVSNGSRTTHSKPDPWASWAHHESRSLPSQGLDPARTSAEHVLAAANKRRSFSTATEILDLGCGPATCTNLLCANYSFPSGTEILAGDSSPTMIQKVQTMREEKVAEGAPHWADVDVRDLDACSLQLSPGRFSHVLAGFVFFLTPEPPKALAEAYRVLAPGGVLCLTSWERNEWMDMWLDVCGAVDPAMHDLGEKTPGKPWRSVESVRSLLEAAGFVDVEGVMFDCGMSYEDPEKILRFLGDVVPIFKESLEKTGQKIEGGREELLRRMVAVLKERHGERAGVMGGRALVVTGKKRA
ncbi:MAG: hypothetical protein Q9159_002479 [Coniocarpon cinnabarinum]